MIAEALMGDGFLPGVSLAVLGLGFAWLVWMIWPFIRPQPRARFVRFEAYNVKRRAKHALQRREDLSGRQWRKRLRELRRLRTNDA